MLTVSHKRWAFLVVACVGFTAALIWISQSGVVPHKAFGGNPTPKPKFGTQWSTVVQEDERTCENVLEPMTLEQPNPKLKYPVARPADLSPEFVLAETHLVYGVCRPDVNHTDTVTEATPSIFTTYSTLKGVSISLWQIKLDYGSAPMQVNGPLYKDVQIDGVRFVVTNVGMDVVQPYIQWTDGQYQYMLWGCGTVLNVDEMLKIAASVKVKSSGT